MGAPCAAIPVRLLIHSKGGSPHPDRAQRDRDRSPLRERYCVVGIDLANEVELR